MSPSQSAAAASQHSTFQPQDHSISKIVNVSLDALKQGSMERAKLLAAPIISERKFTVLFTGDTHSYLEPLVTSFVDPKPLGGIIRRIHCIEKCLKQENPVLVLDAGDWSNAGDIYSLFKGLPDIEFMNMANYHTITVGNHDFDHGWDHLEKLLKESRFKTVCANIFHSEDSSPCFLPYSLVQINDMNVAIVGIMGTDSWKSIRPASRKGLTLKDPIQTLDEVLPGIRPYVDLIILLSHSGIKDDRLFAKHPLVDIVLGGHSHTLMYEQEIVETPLEDHIKRTPVFHSFRHGQLMGKMEVTLSRGKLLETHSSVERLNEDHDTLDTEKNVHIPSIELLEKYKTTLEGKFNTLLGTCIEALPKKDQTERLIPLGENIAEALRKIGNADVGVIPSGSIKNGIAQGPFTVRELHQILAHEEPLWAVTLQGSLLINLMVEGHKRWGNQRTFQYSGVTVKVVDTEIKIYQNENEIDPDSLYKMAGPSFFFERELMDEDFNLFPHLADQVQSIEVKDTDLRNGIAKLIESEGFGHWITGKNQK